VNLPELADVLDEIEWCLTVGTVNRDTDALLGDSTAIGGYLRERGRAARTRQIVRIVECHHNPTALIELMIFSSVGATRYGSIAS
jgi:hypothetical protein